MPSPDKTQVIRAYQAAQRLQAQGKADEALAAYRRIAKAAPRLPEVPFQIARILADQGNWPDARAAVEAALKLKPKEEAIWAVLVDIAKNDGKPAAILARARKAGLSDVALARLDARAKVPIARSAEPVVPGAAEPFIRRASEATRAGDDAGARKLLDRALAKAPGSAPVLIRRAETLMTSGELDAARADAKAAVEAAPEVGGYWRVWARGRKVMADDPLLTQLEARYSEAENGSDHRRQMGFALAKAMEDIGADDRMFGYLNEANALTADRFPYNHAADLEVAELLRNAYTADLVAEWDGKGDDSVAPIFVTGMPRSGTTLVEQILASHSQVTGGGELALLYKPLADIARRIDLDGVKAGADFAKAGAAFATQMARRFPKAARMTDKSIATYAVLGYVPLALPRAKIIVVRRDPRDTCLSVLKTQFADGQHRYSYSMESTAAFYKLFAGQVAFWRERAPEAFIEVQYEDLVADLEGQSRRLLDACDLEWEEGVLDFHTAERKVKTLSTAQVRQPIYSSSVGAWKRHEADLAPLFAALGPIDALP